MDDARQRGVSDRRVLSRNLICTAVTRGRRLVVVVGQPKVLAIVVRGAQARRRWSKLRERLANGTHVAG